MGAWATKSTGNTLTATEFNLLANEIENQETAGTETPSAGSSDQLAKSIVNVVANGDFYTGGGIADVYTATVVAPNVVPSSLRVGMKVRFRPSVNNTGASTIDVASLGAESIKLQNGSSDPVAGDISTARDTELRWDGTNWRIISQFNDASETVKGISELATDAEVATGTDTVRPIVPSALLSLFNACTRGSAGYIRIPVNIGGAFQEIIVQWGRKAVDGDLAAGEKTTTDATSITFPTSVSFVLTGLYEDTGAPIDLTTWWNIATTTTSAIGINYKEISAPTQSGNWGLTWLAIGY